MKDRDFLIWIHERLKTVHGERPWVDYMHKLRAVIGSIPPEQETPNDGTTGIGFHAPSSSISHVSSPSM